MEAIAGLRGRSASAIAGMRGRSASALSSVMGGTMGVAAVGASSSLIIGRFVVRLVVWLVLAAQASMRTRFMASAVASAVVLVRGIDKGRGVMYEASCTRLECFGASVLRFLLLYCRWLYEALAECFGVLLTTIRFMALAVASAVRGLVSLYICCRGVGGWR